MNYNVNIENQSFQLNSDELNDLNLLEAAGGAYHLLHNNQSYHISIIQSDLDAKTVTLEINGVSYELKVEDEYDQLIKSMGLSSSAKQKLSSIKAPMPGLILEILIEPGQSIEKGDQLLILEAMKMENVLKADGEGVVKSVEVKKGDAVEKGQLIIEME